MRHRQDFRSGFSLVELIIVIGILALLIAMLMPALAKARRSAEQVRCASNLRQVGNALVLYANANAGYLPAWSGWQVYPEGSAGPEDLPGTGWTEPLERFFVKPTHEVYTCRAFPEDTGIHYFLSVRWAAVHQPQWKHYQITDVKLSSMFILSGDCTGKEFYYPPFGVTLNHTPPLHDCDKTDEGFKCLVFADEPNGLNMHGGGNNVLFADGHVQAFLSFDKWSMTYHPRKMQSWEDITPD